MSNDNVTADRLAELKSEFAWMTRTWRQAGGETELEMISDLSAAIKELEAH